VAARVLNTRANHRLVLLDWRGDYLSGLRAIADDENEQALQTLSRSGRIAEVCALCLMPVVMFFFVVSVYMPLFIIPTGLMGVLR
jgi:hypothetical protein